MSPLGFLESMDMMGVKAKEEDFRAGFCHAAGTLIAVITVSNYMIFTNSSDISISINIYMHCKQ